MRKTAALATFVALGAGTTAVGALSNISNLKGSDTLFTITRDLIDDAPVLSLTYIGTGSSNGQNALVAAGPPQTIAPMSRAMNNNICGTNGATAGTTSEGLAFALDALSIITTDAIAQSCSDPTTATGCTSQDRGIAFKNTKSFTVEDLNGVAGIQCSAVAAAAGCASPTDTTYEVQNFRDVLRILAAGMPASSSTSSSAAENVRANRDCNSDLRHSLAKSYGNLFQDGNNGDGTCSTGSCGPLQHFFVRDPFSGTTDVFLSLLALPSLALEQPLANSAFCYTRHPGDAWPAGGVVTPGTADGDAFDGVSDGAQPTPPSKSTPPYFTEYQDNDPIRRDCIGTNNNTFSATNPELPPANVPTEQVCGAMGTLGLVLPINPQPGTATTDAYPSAPCSTGKFALIDGPFKNSFESDTCPNGDIPIGGQLCYWPVTSSNSPKCLNERQSLPVFLRTDGAPQATDGRVYNLHLRTDNQAVNHGYAVAPRVNPDGVENGGTISAFEVGAFFRIHSTRSLIASNPSSGACTQDDATQQIACLVNASPCSGGYAGREGPALQAGASGVRVGGVPGDVDSCVQALVAGGTTYPLSRKLYVNTLIGFENVNGAELDLVRRFSAITPAKVTTNGFIPVPGGAFCEDFNESGCSGGPAANTNGCLNNPAVNVAGCGDSIPQVGEVCDDGAGADCNATCSGCSAGLVACNKVCVVGPCP